VLKTENHYFAVLRVLFFKIGRIHPLYILGRDVQWSMALTSGTRKT